MEVCFCALLGLVQPNQTDDLFLTFADFEQVLKLEPGNKQAMDELKKISVVCIIPTNRRTNTICSHLGQILIYFFFHLRTLLPVV